MSSITKNLGLFKYDTETDAKQVFDLNVALNNNWDILDEKASGAGMPVGTIFSHTCSASFVPENSLPCDGTEYAQSQFQTFYNDWLVGGRLNTCTYEEYQTEITTYGKCAKFALDTINRKFKTPYIPNGTHIQQAMTDEELGKSYKAGLPNIKGEFGTASQSQFWQPTGAFKIESAYNGNGVNLTQNFFVSLDASRSSSVYSDDVDTVQTESVALRYFVIVVTGSIKQSEMDWSAWASSLEGKLNADHSNDTKPYISETYENGTSGYVVYSNGLCEQWGFDASSNSSSSTINLLKLYKDTNYQVIVSRILDNGAPDLHTVIVRQLFTNYFIINKVDSVSKVFWRTIGYIA